MSICNRYKKGINRYCTQFLLTLSVTIDFIHLGIRNVKFHGNDNVEHSKSHLIEKEFFSLQHIVAHSTNEFFCRANLSAQENKVIEKIQQ